MNVTHKNKFLQVVCWPFLHFKLTLAIVLLAAGCWMAMKLFRSWQDDEPLVSIMQNTEIDKTPEEITAIRQIGEWEFLSVSTEELVERHESRMMGDKHLVRIYQGTIRIGLDTNDFSDEWFVAKGDTALLTLPGVKILDENFIDEARTSTFYEEGTFDARTKQELYEEARQAMRARAMVPQNLKKAQLSAEQHFKALFKSLGFKEVEVQFTTETDDAKVHHIPTDNSTRPDDVK